MAMDKEGKCGFFKIILEDSTDHLPLPIVFSKEYLEGKISENFELKIGLNIWRVKLFKIKDEYFFLDDWSKFMKDNNIKKFDFLVFYLLSPSTFEVHIFGPNGSLKNKKEPTLSAKDDDENNIAKPKKKARVDEINDEPSAEARVVEESNHDPSTEKKEFAFSRTVKKSHISHFPIESSYAKKSGIGNKYDELRLRNTKGEIWDVTIEKRWREQALCLTKGWNDFMRNNNIEVEDECFFRELKGNSFEVTVKKNHSGRGIPRRFM